MRDATKGKATICIVNYKTLDFTRLCLRSIRKFTNYPYNVIVVDNNSQDESLTYLKSLKWIHLLERDTQNDPNGGYSHAAALDLGLENCHSEFFISMHSDTFVLTNNWLTDLIGYFDGDDNVACVGSGKLELASRWRIMLKKATDLRTFRRKLLRVPDPVGKYRCYNRTICCLYRTDILRRENLSFLMDRDKGFGSGRKLYFELVDRGYKTVKLSAPNMGKYVVHLAHATQVVHPEEFTLHERTIRKYSRTIEKVLSSDIIQGIVTDDSLDE